MIFPKSHTIRGTIGMCTYIFTIKHPPFMLRQHQPIPMDPIMGESMELKVVAAQKESWLSEGPKVLKFNMYGIYVYLPMYLYAIDDVYMIYVYLPR